MTNPKKSPARRQAENDKNPTTANTPANDNPRSAKPHYTELIRKKCFECIQHEPDEPGTHLEQIAYCTVYDCGLFTVRPTPRHTRVNGFVDEAKIQPIIAKIDRINAKRKASGR